MAKKFLLLIVLFTLTAGTFVTPVTASGVTDFGSCLNPQVNASQVNQGNRFGVVGTTKLYSGTDSIYNLSNGNVMQCLCQKDGSGIQTNWLKINKMSKNEVDSYKNSGWIYIITGSTWGLADVPYLAKNLTYSCKGKEVKATAVKGLASTGNTFAIYGLIFAGLTALTFGFFLRKVSK